MLSESELQNFIFGEDGLLILFHHGEGLSDDTLSRLYQHLEEYRVDWVNKTEIPRGIVARLTSLVCGLYHDLEIYDDLPDCHYGPVVAKLATAVEVLLYGKEDLSSGTLSEIIQIDF